MLGQIIGYLTITIAIGYYYGLLILLGDLVCLFGAFYFFILSSREISRIGI